MYIIYIICVFKSSSIFRAFTSVLLNFLSILHEKTYFFYFIHPLLQNTHNSLSILHIYSIKYSLFYNFLLFTPSLPSLSQTHSHHHHHHHHLATITTIIRNQKPLNQKPISRQTDQNSIRTHLISTQNQRKINIRSTNTDQPTQRKINVDQNAIVSMPPCLHTYPDQPTTQINPDQANPHKPRPTHTINSN